MTMTPLATIADALIDFILSLLRDPAAADEYQADPEGTLDRAGLGGACLADVRAVAPVIYDNSAVVARPPQTVSVQAPSHPSTPVQQAISNIVNNFSVDNRATVLDQSVNQNIWAHGDVNQHFDDSAVINTGDNGAAAGHDATVDTSTTDIGGDLGIGNTTTNTTVDDSFNDNSTDTVNDTDTTVTGSFDDTSTTTTADATVDDSFNDNTDSSDNSNHSDNPVDSTVTADDSYDDDSDHPDDSVTSDQSDTDSTVTVEDSFDGYDDHDQP